MTRQEIKDRALRRAREEAQDRHIRLTKARVEREEAALWKKYFAGLDALLKTAAKRERSR